MPKYKKTSTTKHLYGKEFDDLSDETIVIGEEIEEKGEDLPSGKNYVDYFTKSGFDYIKFWYDHKQQFPKLWSYAIEKASCNPTEVSCETLFSESGYASNSRRTKLKSKQFEREVIVSHNLQNIYVDLERAVDIFIKRNDEKEWNDDEDRDALFYMEVEKDLSVGGGAECIGSEGEIVIGSSDESSDDDSEGGGKTGDSTIH